IQQSSSPIVSGAVPVIPVRYSPDETYNADCPSTTSSGGNLTTRSCIPEEIGDGVDLLTDDKRLMQIGASSGLPPVTATEERERPSTSTVDNLYAICLQRDIEIKDLQKIKLQLEIQLLQKILA
ncbi:hypothetical protein LSAT2_012987, partial [Lamellibrachia satsuma]